MGWIIGDEGSGFWMARKGLEAVARAIDGRGPATQIQTILERNNSIRGPAELITAVYKSGILPAGVAAYYPAVVEAARNGDAVANAILDEAAGELAHAATVVVRKLGLERERFPVAVTGGVLGADGPLLPRVRERLLRAAPDAEVGQPCYPPETGAARLAIARNQQ
jgi:N-acetylglucosamine kinase